MFSSRKKTKIKVYGCLMAAALLLYGALFFSTKAMAETPLDTNSTTVSAKTVYKSPFDGSVIRSREYINFDEQLSENLLDKYREVKQINVIYISAPIKDIQNDGEEWTKGLYYYLITKENFPDVPFNVVVTHDGLSFVGKSGTVDVQGFLDANSEKSGTVLIAYLGVDNDYGVDAAGSEKLAQVLGYLASFYSVPKQNIFASEWRIQKPTDLTKPAEIVLQESSTGSKWQARVAQIASTIRYINLGSSRAISAQKTEVINENEAEIGTNLKVTAVYKNVGKFPWYKNSADPIFLFVKSRRSSEFSINKVWLDKDTVTSFDSEWVLPGETARFVFEMFTPLFPGDYSENFELATARGTRVPGSEFSVKFKGIAGTKKLVEILPTGTRALNFRAEPNLKSKVIGALKVGERFLYLETSADGKWTKVKDRDGTDGWVVSKYVKIISN